MAELNFRSRAQADQAIAQTMKKVLGFSRKRRPHLPATEPVYIYNVSDKEFVWKQPGFDRYVVPGCKRNQRVSEPCEISGIVIEEYLKVDETELNMYNGEEIALEICQAGAGKQPQYDLRNLGVFISKNNPPSEEEVHEATNRLNATCENLVREGDRINSEGQSKAQGGVGGQMISGDMVWAAKRSGQGTAWSKATIKQIDCPFCGNSVPENAAVHFGNTGCGAVLDWNRAIAAGLKKESDRPKEKQAKQPEA
jgi:hypothetical protein